MARDLSKAFEAFEKMLEQMNDDEFFSLIGLTAEEARTIAASRLLYSDDSFKYGLNLDTDCTYGEVSTTLMCA